MKPQKALSRLSPLPPPFHVQGEPQPSAASPTTACLSVSWQRGESNEAIAIGEELLFVDLVDYTLACHFWAPLLQLSPNQFELANGFFTWYRQSIRMTWKTGILLRMVHLVRI